MYLYINGYIILSTAVVHIKKHSFCQLNEEKFPLGETHLLMSVKALIAAYFWSSHQTLKLIKWKVYSLSHCMANRVI